MALLTFPQPSEEAIPRPFNYHEGDAYCHLSFEESDFPPMGFDPSAKFIIRQGKTCHAAIHALYTPDGAILARLLFKEGGRVDVYCFHPCFPSGCYDRAELNIEGFVEEIWPIGWNGPRLVLNPAESAESAESALSWPNVAASN